ncbi:phage terminase large subunit family protein [Paenibacillus larvae]|nr:phage terminase large subunit family protein [Paenibacillus larvae]MDT2243118.1 phage terminase large subunit family protein [Paenibacillus larvae]
MLRGPSFSGCEKNNNVLESQNHQGIDTHNKGSSRIEEDYEDSTMEEWCVPCPSCKEYPTFLVETN